jgi:flagellar basal-body rod modification protein FlgD
MTTIGASLINRLSLKDAAAGTPATGAAGTGTTGAGRTGTGATGGNGTTGATGTTGGRTGTTAAGGTSATAGADGADRDTAAEQIGSSETQDRFLQLLVAQMKNQDPMNPLDNAQVTSQMAQISTVEGIEKLNSTMAKFAQTSGMSRAANATGLIGQSVLAPGSKLTWDATTTTMRSGVTLDAAASQVTVELFDAAGKVVDKRTFANPSAGTLGIDWTGVNAAGGKYGAGTYVLRATVMSDAGATATTLTTDTVTGVVDSPDGVVAQLAGGQQVPVGKINGVFDAPAKATTPTPPVATPQG